VRHVLIAEVEVQPTLNLGAGNNKNYFGQIEIPELGSTPAFMKVLDDRQLATEIIVYLAARTLSLPVPVACLALCPVKLLPGSQGWNLGVAGSYKPGYILLFASQQHGQSIAKQIGWPIEESPSGKTFDTLWNSFNARLSSMLVSWTDTAKLICFDQWIANSDRNHGNLVIDSQGAISFIDHERALFEGRWHNLDVSADICCASSLLGMINSIERDKLPLIDEATLMGEAILLQKLSEMVEHARRIVPNAFDRNDEMNITSFLSHRGGKLTSLVQHTAAA
jgi:hypothetical protein